jgi:hypothetical protein
MEVAPTFAGEVQFRRYSDTSTQGTQIVLALPDREALQSFIGLEGKRFMAVLVQIGDDEQPVSANPLIQKESANSRSAREPLGDLCWRAVQWCKEPEFWAWVSTQMWPKDPSQWPVDEEEAKKYVLRTCNVKSRKQLDSSSEARLLFNQLIRGPYQKHLIARGIVR